MIDPEWDKRLIDAFRKRGVSMQRRTPGKSLVKDGDGRYREVGEEQPTGHSVIDGIPYLLWADGRRTPVDPE